MRRRRLYKFYSSRKRDVLCRKFASLDGRFVLAVSRTNVRFAPQNFQAVATSNSPVLKLRFIYFAHYV